MQRIILIYGVLAGLVVISCMTLGIELGRSQAWLGFLVMFIAFGSIYIAIKHHRDDELGGLISFSRALLIGLGISAIAGLVYVVVWEVYLAATDFGFVDDYVDAMVAGKEAAGASDSELAQIARDGDRFRAQYANPFFRLPMTFVEIFPVGLLVSIVSAALLGNRKSKPQSE
ncbi:MAG TPA: DUF4199 domain-containing protein [Woeseiaceae bacterium]|nr:DUF4199 domain-containing protein [Woeseiaceae bacterium]